MLFAALFEVFGLEIRVLDILDFFIALYLIYFIYKYVKGTVAVNIFIGIILFLLLLAAVTQLKMRILTLILGSIAGIGLIGLIVIFQPEIRRMLLMIGDNTLKGRFRFLEKLFIPNSMGDSDKVKALVGEIIQAAKHLSQSQTGALIYISKTEIPSLMKTGVLINARVSQNLLETIFFKNAPLHDGAVVIFEDRILAASCILPLSETNDLSPDLGLRHRAGLGVTESGNGIAIVVSEQDGGISYASEGKLFSKVTFSELRMKLENYYAHILTS
ncbi:MAG: TIGR00159 family protein [Saprospiraceae bacterium]|nr:TIGR00159 family protein [Saprospiraceae bacterium]